MFPYLRLFALSLDSPLLIAPSVFSNVYIWTKILFLIDDFSFLTLICVVSIIYMLHGLFLTLYGIFGVSQRG